MKRVPNEQYRWIILGTLSTLHVFAAIGQYSIPPLLPFIKKEFGLNYTQVGLFTSSYFLGNAFTAIFTGWTADLFGIKRVVLLGTVLTGVSILIASWMPSLWWIMGFLVIAGIGYSFVTPSSNKAMMYWFDERLRGTAMGIKQTGVNGSGFLAAFIIPPLALNFNWHYAFSMAGLLVLMGGIVMLVLYREFDPQPYHQTPSHEWKYQIKQVISNRNVLFLGLEGFFRVGVQNAFLTYSILYFWKGLQLPIITASFLFALTQGMGAIGRVTWGVVSDRMFGGQRKRVYLLVAVISGVFLFILGNLTSATPFWAVILVVAFIGFTVLGFQGVSFSFLGEVAGKEFTGTASGLHQSFCAFGAILAAPFFGFIVDIFGTYFYAWTGLTFFSFIASGLLSFVREESPKKPYHSSLRRKSV